MKPSVAILAGGLATRLGPLVADTPKALLEVANKPFLAWQLELLSEMGIDDVLLCLGHRAEQISDVLTDICPRGLQVRISLDGEAALGTGGALQKALPLLSDPFLVMYGDSYLRCDYLAIHRSFLEAHALGLMTVYRNDNQFDDSNVVFERGRIAQYTKHTKHPQMHHIDWGLGVLSHAAFAPFAAREQFDLAELYETLVAAEKLVGYEVQQRFFEIGSAKGLAELRAWLPAEQT